MKSIFLSLAETRTQVCTIKCLSSTPCSMYDILFSFRNLTSLLCNEFVFLLEMARLSLPVAVSPIYAVSTYFPASNLLFEEGNASISLKVPRN